MFLDTKTRIGNRYGRTDSTTLTRIGEIYNDVLQWVYNETGYTDEVEDHITTISGRMSYPLQPYMNPVRRLMTIPSQNRRIKWVTRDHFDSIPEHTNSGVPARYTIVEQNSVQEQPSSQITAVSDDVSDTTQTLRIRGISHNQYREETLSLNGTTDVVSTYYYTQIIDEPTLSAVTTGNITVDSNSAAVTICSIAAGALTAAFFDPADLISVDSDSASDTQKATVEGLIFGSGSGYDFKGQPFREEVTLNGTTAVPTTNRFTKIFDVSLASVAIGTIRVTAPSMESANKYVGVITPGRMSLDHQIVAFDPVPDGSYGVLYKGTRTPARLVNDGDRPTIDQRTWPTIEKWAEAVFNDYKGDRRGLSMILGAPAFKEDMRNIKGLIGVGVDVVARKGDYAYSLRASRRTRTYHLDPNIYGPGDR